MTSVEATVPAEARKQQQAVVEATARTHVAVRRVPVRPHVRRVGVGLRLVGGGELGTLPGFGPGTGLAVAILLRRVRLELLGNYWFLRTRRIDIMPTNGGDFRAGWVTLRACPRWLIKSIELPVCAGIEVGAIRGRGVGLSDARTFTAPWAAVVAGPALAWMPSRRLGVWIEALGAIALIRPHFIADNFGDVHRPARFGFRALVGVEVRLP